ncbi:MAG: MerR family transcriptional regulator [Candidatus Sumerlaeia bacterium]|nr:MerR family transcriptional regulator [Candidatus Sumerlaeia bacterium]
MGEEQDGLSIGALSRATGISIHSLRMWERRYGAPKSHRRSSGHRRYSYDEVARLRAVSRAMSLGIRPSEVANLEINEINSLIDSLHPGVSDQHPGDPVGSGSASDRIHQWIMAARSFDDYRLDREFLDGWNMLGPIHFITRMAVPFMRELGDCWQTGCVDVANEHFASEKLCDFLASRWRALNNESIYPPMIVAGLPKDRHRGALLMSAVVVASTRHRVVYLGCETPVADLAAAHDTTEAIGGICISISSSVTERSSSRYLEELSTLTPDSTPIITGGAGAPEPTDRIQRLDTFHDLYNWLRERQERDFDQQEVGLQNTNHRQS